MHPDPHLTSLDLTTWQKINPYSSVLLEASPRTPSSWIPHARFCHHHGYRNELVILLSPLIDTTQNCTTILHTTMMHLILPSPTTNWWIHRQGNRQSVTKFDHCIIAFWKFSNNDSLPWNHVIKYAAVSKIKRNFENVHYYLLLLYILT